MQVPEGTWCSEEEAVKRAEQPLNFEFPIDRYVQERKQSACEFWLTKVLI